MADIKTYQIKINGLDVSIDAVKSLNNQLEALEKKINALQGKVVNVSTSVSSGGGNRTGALSEEEKIERQIEQIQEQQAAHQTEQYKALLLEKETLKEINKEQKASTAEIRLQENAYENTMQGMKQHLADIKAAMQTVDLGDTDTFKKLTNEANELNNKLKEIEQSYGVFNRSVGNYASAAEGFKGLKIQVGDTVREFSSAREALRTLSEELKNLSINGEANTEQADQLREAYNNLKSAIDDATISSKAMDEAMDIMASFASIASIGQGLQSFFGLENNEITKSIQNLVSLQSVLQGIEALRKQMDTNEGLGGVFKKGSAEVDKFVAKITGAKIGMNGLAASTKVGTLAVKGLSMALKGVGIGFILEGVSMAIEGLKSLASAAINAFNTEEKQVAALDEAVEGLNRRTSNQMDALNQLYSSNQISKVELLTEQYRLQAQYVERLVAAMRERQQIEGDDVTFGNVATGGTKVVESDFMSRLTRSTLYIRAEDLQELRGEFRKLQDAIEEGSDYFTKYGESLGDYWKSLFSTVSDAVDAQSQVGNAILNDLLGRMAEAENNYSSAMDDLKNGVDGAADRVKAAESTIKSLEAEMNSDDIINSVIANLDRYIPDENVRKQCQNIINSFNAVKNAMNADAADVTKFFEDLAIRILPANEQALARLEKQYKQDLANYGRTEEQKNKITEAYNIERGRLIETQNKKNLKSNKDYGNKVFEAERDLNNLRIQNMKEGLNKQLTQLEEERKAKIAKVRQSGILVAERELEINKLYDKKVEEAKKEHAEKIYKIYDDTYGKIYQLSLQNYQRITDITRNGLELGSEGILKDLSKFFNQGISSYGVQGKSQFSDETSGFLGIFSNEDSEFMERSKQLMDLARETQAAQNLLLKAQGQYNAKKEELNDSELAEEEMLLNRIKAIYENRKEIYDNETKAMKELYGEEKVAHTFNLLQQENYSSRLSYIYTQRLTAIDASWTKRINHEAKSAKALYDAQISEENYGYNRLLADINKREQEELKNAEEHKDEIVEVWRQQGLEEAEAAKEYGKLIDRIVDEHQTERTSIAEEHSQKLLEIERERDERIQKVNSEALQATLQEFRDFTTAINELEANQPVMNAWGITNFKQTNENNRNLLESYRTLATNILSEKINLQNLLNNNEISFDDFQNANRELDRFTADLGQKMDKVKQELSVGEQIGKFIQDIQQYVQVIGQSIQTALSSIDEYADYQLDKEQDNLNKQNELLEEKLSEQEDIIQKHSDKVNDIEDELSTARGDRRQYLIDQLNSEIAAQRAAEAERQRIEREQAALEKKQEALDKKREIQDYNRKLRDILVSGALAVSNAFATSPFVPVGLAMGALATSLTAFQYAMAKKQKPYAKGGLLEGPSHKEGGIPVGNTGIEVEGKEYVVRKKSTANNIPVLDFINKSERKLTLSDFIDFYSSKPRTTIKKIRSKFADGGTLPTNIDISESLDRNIIIRDDSVYQVSVVDINRQQENLKNVQVLAGLN